MNMKKKKGEKTSITEKKPWWIWIYSCYSHVLDKKRDQAEKEWLFLSMENSEKNVKFLANYNWMREKEK